jgi:tetratricopeptide (TPR) repeat protein
VAKRTYSEVKHDDKFHESLARLWGRIEPYMLHVGIAAGAVIVIAAIWMLLVRSESAAKGEPWARHFAIMKQTGVDPEKQIEDYAALASDYEGHPVAAMALIEAAQGYFKLGTDKSLAPPGAEKPEDKAKRTEEARQFFQKAAAAAEKVLEAYPDYPRSDVAAFEAGKARFALEEHERALPHFEAAAASKVLHLAAQAQWHAARCHQALGNIEAARAAYEHVKDNQHASYMRAQAEFDLARLDEEAVREPK